MQYSLSNLNPTTWTPTRHRKRSSSKSGKSIEGTADVEPKHRKFFGVGNKALRGAKAEDSKQRAHDRDPRLEAPDSPDTFDDERLESIPEETRFSELHTLAPTIQTGDPKLERSRSDPEERSNLGVLSPDIFQSRLLELEARIRDEQRRNQELEKERNHLNEELRGRNSEIEKLSSRLDDANRQLDSRKNDIESFYQRQQREYQKQRDDLAEKLKASESHNVTLTRRLEQANTLLDSHKRRLDAQTREHQGRLRELEKKCSSLTEKLTTREREVGLLSRRLGGANQLLESRRRDMESAELFLNSQDTLSGEEIIRHIGDLNTQIVTVATIIAESVVPQPRTSRLSASIGDRQEPEATTFPPLVAALLADVDHSNDPTALQFVIQGILAASLHSIFTSFCYNLPTEMNNMLQDIYDSIVETELQATAARWRSLTHSRLAPSYRPEGTSEKVAFEIIEWIASATSSSGCLSEDDSLPERLNDRFGSHITSILETTFSVIEVLKEKTFSADFIVVVPQYEEEFNPETMEDAFKHASSEHKVIFAIELGLCCRKKILKIQTTDGSFDENLLLKPKVVLDTVFQMLVTD